MMSTVLNIAQSVAYRANLPAPSSLYGSTDPRDLQYLHLIYAVCEALRQARCWRQQIRTHTFHTVSSQASYQLPKDFYSLTLATQWNVDETQRLIGPESDMDFSARLYGTAESSTNFAFRIKGFDENSASAAGQFQVSPTPSSAIELTFEYISRNLFLPPAWAASQSISGANIYRNASGYIYYSTGSGTTGATVPSHTSGSTSDGGVTWTYSADPYETILTDSDLCLFDPDLVKLGLRAKLYFEQGGDWQTPQQEFESKINQAVARFKGNYIGTIGGRDPQPRYSVPYKGWTF